MSWPKHHNPRRQDRRSRAAYNFVPLPERVVLVPREEIPAHDHYAEHTGCIACELTTLTPLYTRAALAPDFWRELGADRRRSLADDAKRSAYARFFYLDDMEHPVIPGSSLRGMIRALVEIAGYGKVQWVSAEPLFFRTVDDTALGTYYRGRMTNRVEMGFLRRNQEGYYIARTQAAGLRRDQLDNAALYEGSRPNETPRWQGRVRQHMPLWVRLTADQRFVQDCNPGLRRGEGWHEGRLVITGNMPKKTKEFVFLLPPNDAERISVDDDTMRLFCSDAQLTQWQERAFPVDQPRQGARRRPGYVLNDALLQEEGEPVFFLREEGKLVFLGRAGMFRLPYRRIPLDLVPENLRCDEEIDLAEAVFGTVAGGRPVAGRVFFEDAHYTDAPDGLWLSDKPLVPPVLATPKPTSFQHYLVQDWNRKHDPDHARSLAHYDTASPSETVIRGHKLYWHAAHAGGPTADDLRGSEEPIDWGSDTQHTVVRPVRAGVTFRFRVRFENLRDHELGALLWALDLPADHAHKLGMGKPLGMGSVRLTPRLVLSDRSARYRRLFEADHQWHLAEKTVDDLAPWKRAFEAYVLERIDPGERGAATALDQVPRMQALMAMLRYQPPPPAEEIVDPHSPDAFRRRPVLPNPDDVLSGKARREHTQQRPAPRRSARGQAQSAESPARAAAAEATVSRPDTADEIAAGMYLEGRVAEHDAQQVVVDVLVDNGRMMLDEIAAVDSQLKRLREVDLVEMALYEGRRLHVRARGRNKKGNLRLEFVRWLDDVRPTAGE